jgi:hypothetical protein
MKHNRIYTPERPASAYGLACRFVSSLLLTLLCSGAGAETVVVIASSNAAPRVQFGTERLTEALRSVGIGTALAGSPNASGRNITVSASVNHGFRAEGFQLDTGARGSLTVAGCDNSGALYGCLELARRIRESGGLPADLHVADAPQFKLRGTCIGMQKTFILPGRKVYEYPYTPDLFPWFYDRKFWQEYLDFLVQCRMNTLYLWNGHPFASLVRPADYPYAVEVPEDVFARNVQMFRYITRECDKRGIWLVQMFYNILLSKPFAEQNGLPTQLAAPTPLAADYTRKSIAEFVKQYPNVGLMVCLGEALQDTPNQLNWCTNVILPGVLDGMRGAALKEPPPIVIRTHAMDAHAIIPAAKAIYTNLFTETKYNGESLTTWEPRGRSQAIHLAMSKLAPHLVNVHILSNLEPFRYGAQQFIKKSMQAARDRLGATGLHLYPLAYWSWPDSPDIAEPPLQQWRRDWIWFEAWGRYSWNPDLSDPEDRTYWVSRLARVYGNNRAAEHILDAYNLSGECAPRLVRRFGITEGNRQTLSLGMRLDQLVNPKKYNVFPDLWESQAPPGERLQDYARREWNREAHEGETPASIIREVLDYSRRAVAAADSAAPLVKTNLAEFERLRNDTRCIQAMSECYAAKAEAALHVLRYDYSHDLADMKQAEAKLSDSLEHFRKLTALTRPSYHFANTMQTSQRKIPFPGGASGVRTNYHWVQLLPLYEKELQDFRAQVAALREAGPTARVDDSKIPPLSPANFKLISTNAENYLVEPGAWVFTDRRSAVIGDLAPELRGLTGIRISHEAARSGRYGPVEFEVSEPVQVLVGYFKSDQREWLKVPRLEFAAQADERGGVETLIENAAAIAGCPAVNIHAFSYGPGRHRLELLGQGSFVVLGVVPQSAKITRRDAGKGARS